MKKIVINQEGITIVEPDYEGLAKTLGKFIELYSVCENKELIERLMSKTIGFTITYPDRNEEGSFNLVFDIEKFKEEHIEEL